MNNEIKINVPEGMEIDKENSTFECIKFKPKWVPKRGDIATTGGEPNQIILIADYVVQNPFIIGFDIIPLAVLCRKHLVLYEKDSTPSILWAKQEASSSEKEQLVKELNEQGYVYNPNDPRVIYKKEKELPKTWEEFCENNPRREGEYFIDDYSKITEACPSQEGMGREIIEDANVLPSKEYAEAMLALCKLIQLRDCYNGNWKPNWKEESFKYVIKFFNEDIYKDCPLRSRNFLAFKTKELRDAFCNNFEDLIKEAKLLL